MNLKDLQTLDAFEQETINKCDRFTVNDAIDDMYHFGNKILEAMRLIDENGDTSIISQFLYDSIKANVNDYVQSFLDVVSILFANSDTMRGEKVCSIRQAIRFYISTFSNYSTKCEKWIEFLQRRNELVHEYYNYEFMLKELKIALANYSDGILELADSIRENIEKQNLQQFIIRK